MAFVSGQDVDFSCETEMLQQKVPDGVLVVAGALDAAMICQGLRRFGLKNTHHIKRVGHDIRFCASRRPGGGGCDLFTCFCQAESKKALSRF